MHGLLFYLHHRKLSATAFTERRDSSGENTAVPGEYGIFIPLLFSASENLRKSIGISLEKKKRNPKNVLVESSYQVKMREERT